jgi:hypothetical protein
VASDALRIASVACAQLELHPDEAVYAGLCVDAHRLARRARPRCIACASAG